MGQIRKEQFLLQSFMNFRTQKGTRVLILEVKLIVSVTTFIKNTRLGPTVKELAYEPWNEGIVLCQVKQRGWLPVNLSR